MWPVKIKANNYGEAIGLLIRLGGGFQTRFEDTLVVNAEQRRILEEAGFVEADGTGQKKGKGCGEKAEASEKV